MNERLVLPFRVLLSVQPFVWILFKNGIFQPDLSGSAGNWDFGYKDNGGGNAGLLRSTLFCYRIRML